VSAEIVEGPPTTEGPSKVGVRESEDSVVHPSPTGTASKYRPGEQGVQGTWAKMPAEAVHLPYTQMRVLYAYSRFANRYRLTYVSENRIAEELGWYYGKKRLPNRRHIKPHRDALIENGFMVNAGKRTVPGEDKWVSSYLVAPYTQEQLFDVKMRQALAPSMRRFSKPDAPIPLHSMRLPRAHIQNEQIYRTERDDERPLRGTSSLEPETNTQPSPEEGQEPPPWVREGVSWEAWAKELATGALAEGDEPDIEEPQ
jgi:hypothetical protein